MRNGNGTHSALEDLLLEEVVQQEVGETGVLVESLFDVAKEHTEGRGGEGRGGEGEGVN